HGTHVAGTIAALDNTEGVVGVAPGARIWSVKTLGTGTDWESEEIAGINWVTERAATIEVANMSIECAGGLPCKATEAWTVAISKSVEKGVVYVAAAGNNGGDAKESVYGTHPGLITVSAIADFDGIPNQEAEANACRKEFETAFGAHNDDTHAKFSNYGEAVEIAAPGVCIRSTVTGKTYAEAKWWGTSMAAPHVSGAAAILASMSNPNSKADVEKIRKEIIEAGNEGWTNTSPSEFPKKLLDVSSETVFAPK
ncbi:MAG TPA: S8 family serine peptidase, partial [Solirubrobacterales bacterium]|nr:S8 family serine peptidase [Solirubrobacterales bacterium]